MSEREQFLHNESVSAVVPDFTETVTRVRDELEASRALTNARRAFSDLGSIMEILTRIEEHGKRETKPYLQRDLAKIATDFEREMLFAAEAYEAAESASETDRMRELQMKMYSIINRYDTSTRLWKVAADTEDQYEQRKKYLAH